MSTYGYALSILSRKDVCKMDTSTVKVAEITHQLSNVMQAVLGNQEVRNYRVRFGPYAMHVEDVISDIANSFLKKYGLSYREGNVVTREGHITAPLFVCYLLFKDPKAFYDTDSGEIQRVTFRPNDSIPDDLTLNELKRRVQLKSSS